MALMTPKNYNRIYLMNLGTTEEPDWKPITVGISATEVEVEEEAEDYYYMDVSNSFSILSMKETA